MKLSSLIYALTVIAYAALQLGPRFYDMRLVWWGVIIGTVVWIFEHLVDGTPVVPHLARRSKSAPAE